MFFFIKQSSNSSIFNGEKNYRINKFNRNWNGKERSWDWPEERIESNERSNNRFCGHVLAEFSKSFSGVRVLIIFGFSSSSSCACLNPIECVTFIKCCLLFSCICQRLEIIVSLFINKISGFETWIFRFNLKNVIWVHLLTLLGCNC